jgi:serine/threonine protein kinase
MSANPTDKLLQFAGLLAREYRRAGAVDVAALAGANGRPELLPKLTRLLEMLEVWVRLRAGGAEQPPADFAAGFGAEDDLRAAFLEAAATWHLLESQPGAESGPSAAPPPGPAAEEDLPGQDVDGRRVITGHSLVAVRNWTAGGPAVVGEGDDVILHRRVAVKTPRNPDYPRFAQEIELTGSFVHPHIVPVFSLAFDKAGKPAFIMPLIGGGTLTETIDRHHRSRRSPDEQRAGLHRLLRHLVTAARTVHYAHTRRPAVIHRDLKPDNLLLDEAGNLYVADWGHGYRADHLEAPSPGFGTLPYAAPEQWAGTPPGVRLDAHLILFALNSLPSRDQGQAVVQALRRGEDLADACRAAGVDFADLLRRAGIDLAAELARPGVRADVYSLGATLYHVVTGKAPFSPGCPDADKRGNRFVPPEWAARGCDRELAKIIHKAMATDPDERYASADDFADDLERFSGRLVDEPIRAYKPGEEPLGVRLRRGIRRRAGLIAGLLLVLGLAGVLALSTTAERQVALVNGQEQAQAELAQSRAKSDRDLRDEKARGEQAVVAARLQGEQRLHEEQQKAAQDLEAERKHTREAEVETQRLQQALGRMAFYSGLNDRLHKAQTGARQELSAPERAGIDRFVRRVELDLAAAEAQRLGVQRTASAALGEYLLRENVLRATAPHGAEMPRPALTEPDLAVLDHQTRLPLREPPQSRAALELRDQLVATCEHDRGLLGRIQKWTEVPDARNPTAGLMHDATDLVISGRAENVPAAVAREGAEARRLAFGQFLDAYLDGRSFPEALKAAQVRPGKLLDPTLTAQADQAVVGEMQRFPSEEALAGKFRAQPPTADFVMERPRFGGLGGVPPDGRPPGPGGPVGPAEGPLSPKGSPEPTDFAGVMKSVHQTEAGERVVAPEFALGYEDLFPSRLRAAPTTPYERLVEGQLKEVKGLSPEVEAYWRTWGRATSPAIERAYDIGRLKGFHRVGTDARMPDHRP